MAKSLNVAVTSGVCQHVRRKAETAANALSVAGVVLLLLAPFPARALELTGVLAYRQTMQNIPGPFWCTAVNGRNCRPLGLSLSGPPGLRTAPLLNRADGTINIPLEPGPQVFTALWGYVAGEFPLVMMIVNFYLNGDNDTPAISALVPGTTGFANFSANPQSYTYSIDGYESDNNGQLAFDDGTLQARLGAAFYLPSEGITNRWRPSDMIDIDRVGLKWLAPDGLFDGILVFELDVGPSQAQPTPQSAPSTFGFGGDGAPLQGRLGVDQWVPPPTSSLRGAVPTPDVSGESVAAEEVQEPAPDFEATPVPATMATPAPDVPAATESPRRTPVPSVAEPGQSPGSTASAVARPKVTATPAPTTVRAGR